MSARVRAVLMLVLGLASGARAAEVRGQVVDATTKRPLPDVVITATSSSLQGEAVVVTDPQGEYRIPELPFDVFTLRFEKESFAPYTRGSLVLRAGHDLRVEVKLVRDSVRNEGVYTRYEGPPTIDVTSTRTEWHVDSDFPQLIPTGGIR